MDELPWKIWAAILETADYNLLIRDGCSSTKGKIEKAWEKIYNEYLKDFGSVSRDYIEWIRIRHKLHKLRIKFLIKQDRKIMTFIQIKEKELEEMEESGENVKFASIIPSIEMQLKFTLNENTVSTRKVYQYIEMLSDKPKVDGIG